MRLSRGVPMPLICRLSEITDHSLLLLDLTTESMDLTSLGQGRFVQILGRRVRVAEELIGMVK